MAEKQLENLKPIIQLSHQFQNTKPVFAFYLKTYACEKVHTVMKQLQAQGQDVTLLSDTLNQWFNDVDQIKKANPQLFGNKQACQQEMTEYTLKLFLKSDNEERDDTFTVDTVKNFKICASLLEALAVFGPLSQDLEKKKKYAKVMAVKTMKKLRDPSYVRKNNNIDKKIEFIENKIQQQSLNDDGNVGDEGISSRPNQAYVSNFQKKPINTNQGQSQNFNYNQQQGNQFNSNNNNNNNYPNNLSNNNQFNNQNMNANNNNMGNDNFQSVFNQVPKVINKSTITNQQQFAQILDGNQNQNQNQIQNQNQQNNQIQNQNQNQNQNNNLLNIQQQGTSQVASRFQTKKGVPVGILKSQIKKLCDEAMQECDYKNASEAKATLEKTLELFDEIMA